MLDRLKNQSLGWKLRNNFINFKIIIIFLPKKICNDSFDSSIFFAIMVGHEKIKWAWFLISNA